MNISMVRIEAGAYPHRGVIYMALTEHRTRVVDQLRYTHTDLQIAEILGCSWRIVENIRRANGWQRYGTDRYDRVSQRRGSEPPLNETRARLLVLYKAAIWRVNIVRQLRWVLTIPELAAFTQAPERWIELEIEMIEWSENYLSLEEPVQLRLVA